MSRIYVALDLEFTGLDVGKDEIIEIGLVKFRDQEVLETFDSFVQPKRPIPLRIQQLCGITDTDVRRAPAFGALRGRILSFVQSHPVVGHNIDMDLRFARSQDLNLQNLAIDTFELATILIPEAQRYGLEQLSELLGIKQPTTHRALADAMATRELLLALIQRASMWDTSLLTEVCSVAENSDWPVLRIFRDILDDRRNGHNEGNLTLKALPNSIKKSTLSENVAPLQPKEQIEPVDVEPLVASLSPGGALDRVFPGYEYRPQQIDMMRAVAEAMNIPTHLLVEAGTGTGKSLAYLLPSIAFAVQNQQRVIVSSNTINLQDQLFNKDIPALREILPLDFRAALLKGRSNYLCQRRLAYFRRSRQLSTDEARVLAKVFAWLPTTETGDRAELMLMRDENAVWGEIQSTPETCIRDACPFKTSGQCYYFQARERAERAHVIVINHALLLTDLALENPMLPECRYVIIDEAHHLEEQATSQFGLEASRQAVYLYLNNLGHERNGVPGGLLSTVPAVFHREGTNESLRQRMSELIEGILRTIDAAERRLYELFNIVTQFIEDHTEGSRQKTDYAQQTRITAGLRAQPGWSDVEIAWENLSAPLQEILKSLSSLNEYFENLGVSQDPAITEISLNLRAEMLHGQELWYGLNTILMEPDDNTICWISVDRQQEITLNSAPLHVAPLLADRLFAAKDCVILTSATLRTDESFGYIRERLGLEDPLELAVDSPFDYKSAVLLYVPKDIPEPNQPYYQKSVEQAIVDLCRATDGRLMALFTSNSQLYATAYAIRPILEPEGIVVFGQGIDGSRRQILDAFRSTPRSVLLGTRSFWEGVDIVGEALSCLVIARIPFSVPTDPVFAARAETFTDPFNEYYLPDAILRFRQGFGRLIRSKEDFGVVAVLDKRILTKTYGRTVLRSLPRCTARQGPLASLPRSAARWLDPAQRER